MSSAEDTLSDISSIRLPTQDFLLDGEAEDKPVIDPTFLNDNPEWKAARERVVSI